MPVNVEPCGPLFGVAIALPLLFWSSSGFVSGSDFCGPLFGVPMGSSVTTGIGIITTPNGVGTGRGTIFTLSELFSASFCAASAAAVAFVPSNAPAEPPISVASATVVAL